MLEQPVLSENVGSPTWVSKLGVRALVSAIQQCGLKVASQVPTIIHSEDLKEDVMVRHEAAEALGAIGNLTAMSTLEKFASDEEVVVAESCEVAIDLLNWVSSKRLEYSD